ncbi:hypothetical protein ACFLYN_03715 [Chloroflexota bacterium]
MAELADRVGEVIEAGTTDLTAQCYELYESPPLGRLVKTADEGVEIYAIVCNAATSGIEPGRRPIARGKDETSEEGVYSSSPQLLKLLRTEFDAVVAGYKQDGRLFHYLPPRPARIHSFVYLCQAEEIKEFSVSFDFLTILLNTHQEVAAEEIVSASLRRMAEVQEDPREFMVRAGKELAVLLGGEFNRLRAILGRIKTEQ